MPERRPQSPATECVAPAQERPNGTFVIHAVAHTHWDREWYHSQSRFGARLVGLIDALLARDVTNTPAPFLLDGQTIVLRDYLALRPDRKDEIVQALSTGQLEAGPWYVLADNLIPSGEAIIRNLEAGRRVLRRLGASSPLVMYCPDTFGHPAALPSIAAGFGCAVAIVWRGYGGASFPANDTAWWNGADGARVLLYHLPPDGYEFGSALPTAASDLAARWETIAAVLQARNHTGCALLTIGADHHAPSPHLSSALAQLIALANEDGVDVRRSSLSSACAALFDAAHDASRRNALTIPDVRGELRDSYGYTWTLGGTLGTRAQLKRNNARLERALLRDVEPWVALAWLHAPPSAFRTAVDASLNLTQLPAVTSHAWELLLETHPHDTLCGCSIDSVATRMVATQQSVASLVPELRESALALALSHDRVAARARPIRTIAAVVARNRAAYARGGIAEVRLTETIGDVVVGPGGAHVVQPAADRSPTTIAQRAIAAADALIGCAMQFGGTRITHQRRESPQHYPDDDLVRVHEVVAWLPPVPAHGVRVFPANSDSARETPSRPRAPVESSRHGTVLSMDNGIVRVDVSANGVNLSTGNRKLTDVLRLETRRDIGDSYTPALRGEAISLTLTQVRAGAKGPLRASVHLRWQWKSGRERIAVWTTLILDAESTHIRCDVRGYNGRRNHRLQLVWRTDLVDMRVMSDAAFGPVERTPICAAPDGLASTALKEAPVTTMPLHRWLTAHDDDGGATLFSDGLAEGEATEGRLAVTLVRSIGELSRADLPERPGHAGWPCEIPTAQSRGAFRARLGFMLHDAWSDRTVEHIEQAADALLLPLVADSWRDLERVGAALAGPTLRGEGLVCSTIQVSDDAETLTLRAINQRDATGHGAWMLPEGAWRIRRARLDGEPLDEWAIVSSILPIHARPREIVTHQVQRVIDDAVR